MKFRYVPFWLYCLFIVVPILAVGFIANAFEVFLYEISPEFPIIRQYIRIFSTVFALCVSLIAILIFARFRARIGYIFPFYPIILYKDGIKFDLPLQISGFIAWRNILRVDRNFQINGVWTITFEFKHKLPVGPAGAERELSRLILFGNQIFPSGEEFMQAAERYHRQATSGHSAGRG